MRSIKRGFTLLEMLVVISIIGVLVGIGAISYSTAQKKARDTKRNLDLKAIQNCMEQNYSVNNSQYEELLGGIDDVAIQCGDNKTLQVKDPLSPNQVYSVDSSSTLDYTVSATLEIPRGTETTVTISNLQ